MYEFFERYLGVRFLTHDHTYAPPQTALGEIPCEQYSFIPPFSLRWCYYKETFLRPHFATRIRDNIGSQGGSSSEKRPAGGRLGGTSRQNQIRGSGIARMVPVAEYGTDHPEYFALVAGERKLTGMHGRPQACVTNPEVIKIAARNAIRFLDENPDWNHVGLSANDHDWFCQCENCDVINRREGTPMGSHLAFLNAVGELVERVHPDRKVAAEAYLHTKKAPKTIRPRHNVQILLSPIEACALHGYDGGECTRNDKLGRDMAEWAEISDDLWVWDFFTNFGSFGLPHASLRAISEKLRFYHEHNVRGICMQCCCSTVAGALSDLYNYVNARCLWNPTLDSWVLAEEFCRLHYQNAAQPIIDHLRAIHDNAETLGNHPVCAAMPDDVGLNMDNVKNSFTFFERALELAVDQTVRNRVEKASLTAYTAMLETAEFVYKDGTYRLDLPAGYEHIYGRYIDVGQRHELTHAAEGVHTADYFDQVWRAKRGFPAVSLENSHWHLVVLPQNNGQMVEMTYKPTGRNLLSKRGAASSSTCDFIQRARSVHEELGLIGYDHENPREFTVHSTDQSSMTLSKKTSDGLTVLRNIWLSDQDPAKVFCKTTVTNDGPDVKTCQIKVQPQFGTATDTNDWNFNSDIIAGYIKNDCWVKFNEKWGHTGDYGAFIPDSEFGPNMDLLKSAKGGAFAFFNHEHGFGALDIYDPAQFVRLNFFWSTFSALALLELITHPVELKQGDSYEFSYQFEYLDKPPV